MKKFTDKMVEEIMVEQDMCTFINMMVHDMEFEEAQKQAITDMKEARE